MRSNCMRCNMKAHVRIYMLFGQNCTAMFEYQRLYILNISAGRYPFFAVSNNIINIIIIAINAHTDHMSHEPKQACCFQYNNINNDHNIIILMKWLTMILSNDIVLHCRSVCLWCVECLYHASFFLLWSSEWNRDLFPLWHTHSFSLFFFFEQFNRLFAIARLDFLTIHIFTMVLLFIIILDISYCYRRLQMNKKSIRKKIIRMNNSKCLIIYVPNAYEYIYIEDRCMFIYKNWNGEIRRNNFKWLAKMR